MGMFTMMDNLFFLNEKVTKEMWTLREWGRGDLIFSKGSFVSDVLCSGELAQRWVWHEASGRGVHEEEYKSLAVG